MLVRVFPDKEVFYDTDNLEYNCTNQKCTECPIKDMRGVCSKEIPRILLGRLLREKQELIDLLCMYQEKKD